METVAFITLEDSIDLIVAFAVMDPTDPAEIESLTLLRTPKYERLLEDAERGVKVSFERYDEEEDEFLQEAHFDRDAAVVRLKTRRRDYELDVRKVDKDEIKAMRKVLVKMNFDHRFQLSGV